jgi:16S rRNA methyltransferase RsmB/F
MIIAQRGVQLLKTGGLMVYSTCSMSPLEDEAVIAELLRHFKGQLELVDPREFVPVFKARPGLSTWHVLDDAKAIRKQASAKKFSTKKARYEARLGIEPVVEVKEGEEADATASSETPSIYGPAGPAAVKAKVEYVQPQNASAIVEDDSEPAGMVVGDTPEEAEGRAEYVQVMPEDPLLGKYVCGGRIESR